MNRVVARRQGVRDERWRFVLDNRFAILLGTMVVLLLSTPFVRVFGTATYPKLANVVIPAFFCAMLLSAMFAVSRTRLTQIVSLLFAVPAVVLQVVQSLFASDRIAIAGHLFGMAFMAFAAVLILKFFFTSRLVTSDTICASLCVYLLIGVMCAVAYSLLFYLDPDSFAFAYAEEGAADVIRFGGERTYVAIYYSFVTMSTLGYGDIVPISSPARTCAAMQAVFGQLYLAVLVARLVGLHISQSTDRSLTAPSDGRDAKY